MNITIKVDATEATRFMSDMQREQLPFAVSRAINAVTVAGQRAVQASLPAHFLLRRKPFIERTVKMLQFAHKSGKPAILGIDPTRDFLAKFEQGGQKQAQTGKLAVPILRVNTPTKVIRSTDPLHLRNLDLRDGKGARGTFIVRSKKGNTVVLQRMARKRKGTPAGRDPYVRVLYVFKQQVPIHADLGFVPTVRRVIEAEWTNAFAEALAGALKSARHK